MRSTEGLNVMLCFSVYRAQAYAVRYRTAVPFTSRILQC